MSRSGLTTPNVVVLGAGGILGEAWMNAVLAGLEQGGGLDARACDLYVGTSAGAIVAASLAAGIPPRERLGRLSQEPGAALQGDAGARLDTKVALGALTGWVAGPIASAALLFAAPAGALVRRAALAAMPVGRRSLAGLARAIERSGVRWDGRLRIAAVQRETGRRVVFGAARSPRLPVALAVQASCAVPGLFEPVRANGRTYVDGGVWSPTNMDTVEAAGGQTVLCLNPTGSLAASSGALPGAFGQVSRAIVAAETLALRHRGASVRTISPDRASAAQLGANFMDARRRSAVIEAGLAQGRALAATSG
jgi:NTE family protein